MCGDLQFTVNSRLFGTIKKNKSKTDFRKRNGVSFENNYKLIFTVIVETQTSVDKFEFMNCERQMGSNSSQFLLKLRFV